MKTEQIRSGTGPNPNRKHVYLQADALPAIKSKVRGTLLLLSRMEILSEGQKTSVMAAIMMQEELLEVLKTQTGAPQPKIILTRLGYLA